MRIRATIVVLRADEVLLVRDRGQTRYSLPGGGIHPDEPVLAAAARELYEELGMAALRAERRPDGDIDGSVNRHHVVQIWTDDVPAIRGSELSDFRWWNRREQVPRFPHVDGILAKLKDLQP